MTSYRHTQTATWTLYLLAAILLLDLVLAVYINEPEVWGIAGLTSLVLVLVGWLFSSIAVEVTPDALHWHFGPGFWKKRIARGEIAGASPIRTKWWYGWGIRITPRGWLYNVSGLDAVAVTNRAGKTTLIGTDEPDALAAALRN